MKRRSIIFQIEGLGLMTEDLQSTEHLQTQNFHCLYLAESLLWWLLCLTRVPPSIQTVTKIHSTYAAIRIWAGKQFRVSVSIGTIRQ